MYQKRTFNSGHTAPPTPLRATEIFAGLATDEIVSSRRFGVCVQIHHLSVFPNFHKLPTQSGNKRQLTVK